MWFFTEPALLLSMDLITPPLWISLDIISDGKRYERIEDNGETVEEGRLIGRKLHEIAFDLIEEARQSLGIEDHYYNNN